MLPISTNTVSCHFVATVPRPRSRLSPRKSSRPQNTAATNESSKEPRRKTMLRPKKSVGAGRVSIAVVSEVSEPLSPDKKDVFFRAL